MTVTCTSLRESELPSSTPSVRLGIVIPAFNEAQHLPGVLAACRAIRPVVVVVVDDCSTDATPAVLAREPEVDGSGVRLRSIRNVRNLGKQGAARRGLLELAPLDLDAVALIDGDGQHDPSDLPRLAALLQDHDMVIGVRSHDQMPPLRRFSNWAVNQCFRWIGGVDFVDVQSGLRLYRKPLADLLARRLPVDGGYGLEHESLAVLARHAAQRRVDLRVAATPVPCTYGVARSKMRLSHVIELGVETVRQALRIRRALRGGRVSERDAALPRALTVEIHDISPAARLEVSEISAALAKIGVEHPTLLVVPSYVDERGRRWDLRDDAGLVAWLRVQQEAGAEIVQHGLTHRAPSPPPPGLENAFMHHWFSQGCAEFAHLSSAEATERLLAGRQILVECGLHPSGFIAPAWQQSPAAIGMLAQLGYRFTAFFNHVLPLAGDPRPVPTPALTFVAPSPLLDYAKRLVMRGLEAVARPAPLLRVALHPSDLYGARPLPHAINRVQALLRHRRLVTYSEWLAERPAFAEAA
jgi:predicted deacetylase